MQRLPVYPAKRGASEYFDIEAYAGTPSGSEITSAVLKPAKLNGLEPVDAAVVATESSIQFVAASGAAKAKLDALIKLSGELAN